MEAFLPSWIFERALEAWGSWGYGPIFVSDFVSHPPQSRWLRWGLFFFRFRESLCCVSRLLDMPQGGRNIWVVPGVLNAEISMLRHVSTRPDAASLSFLSPSVSSGPVVNLAQFPTVLQSLLPFGNTGCHGAGSILPTGFGVCEEMSGHEKVRCGPPYIWRSERGVIKAGRGRQFCFARVTDSESRRKKRIRTPTRTRGNAENASEQEAVCRNAVMAVYLCRWVSFFPGKWTGESSKGLNAAQRATTCRN